MPDTELLPKSKAEAVRRLEVFTGAGRRRAWTAEQKAGIVAESYEDGDTVSAVSPTSSVMNSRRFTARASHAFRAKG
jgi:transposase